MERTINETVDGWEISLNRNVHMYCHALSVSKGNQRISIDCEDLPSEEKTIGIWLHNLDAPISLKEELQQVLLKWASKYEVKFRIYLTRDDFATNNYCA